ncbi:MAG TPA: biotin/lipoyl-binding protein [Acidobacteriaceae bacterium]|nr:biotin/lipoyl-binding protein [Acidobacteriaceae bacterium]
MRKLSKRLLYVLLFVIAFFVIKAKFFTPPSVMVTRVRQHEVQGTGTITVDQQADIGAKIAGRIDRVFVDQGDLVHKGQLIATLEDTDIRRQIQLSEALVQAACGDTGGVRDRRGKARDRMASAARLGT